MKNKKKTNTIFDINKPSKKKHKPNEPMGAPEVGKMKKEVEEKMEKHRRGF